MIKSDDGTKEGGGQAQIVQMIRTGNGLNQWKTKIFKLLF